MRKSTIKLCVIEIVLFVLLLLNTFVINIYKEYTMAFIISIMLCLAIPIVGYEKANHRFRKDVILTVLIYTLIFYIFTYLSGLYLGFIKNGYSLDFIDIIKNMSIYVFIIGLSELLRYVINTKGSKDKIVIILSVLLFIFIDVILQIHLYDLKVGSDIFKLVALIILPSITKNILLTYTTLKFGWMPNITYRFVMELPIYFLPIFPNLNEYLKSILMLLFPMLLFYRIYESYKRNVINNKDYKERVLTILIITVTIIFVVLTSGIFKYYALAVGSDSMRPTINQGDIIIVEKVKDFNQLKVDDILVYQRINTVIIHRIVSIEYIGENYFFKTKGDNNANEDYWLVIDKEVLGKAVFRIPYIGYPTVWLNEALDGGK